MKTLIIDMSENPKYGLAVNGTLYLCQDFYDFEYTETLVSLLNLEIDEVIIIIKPTGLMDTSLLSYAEVNGKHVCGSVYDINETLELCQLNDIRELKLFSYIDYYQLMAKGKMYILDGAPAGKFIGCYFVNGDLKDFIIGSLSAVEERIQLIREIEPELRIFNSRSFRLPVYPSNLDYKTVGRSIEEINPILFTLTGIPKHMIKEPVAVPKEFNSAPPQVENNIELVTTKVEEVVAPKAKVKHTSNKPAAKVVAKEKYQENKKQKKEANNTTTGLTDAISGAVNVILCLLLGIALCLIIQVPKDVAGLNNYAYNKSMSRDLIESQLKNITRVELASSNKSLRSEVLYAAVKQVPLDGVIGSLAIDGDSVDLTVYMNTLDNLSLYKDELAKIIIVEDMENAGTISVGGGSMYKIHLTGTLELE